MRVNHDPSTPPGSLRVWWIPQVPGKPFHVPVADVAQAKLVLTTLARIKPDYANIGGLEVFEDGGWVEWYEDWSGDDIGDVMVREVA